MTVRFKNFSQSHTAVVCEVAFPDPGKILQFVVNSYLNFSIRMNRKGREEKFNLSISSLQNEFSSPAESSPNPLSCRLFSLRSSSFQHVVDECRASANKAQIVSVKLHPLSLRVRKKKSLCYFYSIC